MRFVALLLALSLALGACSEDAPRAPPPKTPSAEAPRPEASTFAVVLIDDGGRKIQAIKAVRQVTRLSLEDAKDLVDRAPSVVGEDLPEAAARAMAAVLEEHGATVEVRPSGADLPRPEEAAEPRAGATFSVVLTDPGPEKIGAIKALRKVTGLGLADAKALADGVPALVASGLSKTAAAEMTQVLAESGATVEIRLE